MRQNNCYINRHLDIIRTLAKSDTVSTWKLENLTFELCIVKIRRLVESVQKSLAHNTYQQPTVMGKTHLSHIDTNIINNSLNNNEFPTTLRTSIITPIPKITKPTEPGHFRPLSLQPHLPLLIEKCATINRLFRGKQSLLQRPIRVSGIPLM